MSTNDQCTMCLTDQRDDWRALDNFDWPTMGGSVEYNARQCPECDGIQCRRDGTAEPWIWTGL